MIFTKKIGRDVDSNKIDPVKHSQFVISRVAMYRNINEWELLLKEYGTTKVKDELLKTRYLDKYTLNFCSEYFNIPKKNLDAAFYNNQTRHTGTK